MVTFAIVVGGLGVVMFVIGSLPERRR